MAASNGEGIHSARLGLPRYRRRGQHVRRPNKPTFFANGRRWLWTSSRVDDA